jgi:hypothetical protein
MGQESREGVDGARLEILDAVLAAFERKEEREELQQRMSP